MPARKSSAAPAKGASPERQRLHESDTRTRNWKRWGPYLSERQWGTVREDYSANGDAWRYFPHEHARSRTYRWGEDGLMGFTDRQCRLCFSLALWNGQDSILKERLFGLSGPEGNHGEDVKELYYYLDSTPTNSYVKSLYKYPQKAFPYEQLVVENARRGLKDPEYEILDTGAFNENRYWDVCCEYAKQAPDDILIRITLANRGPEEATLRLLPTLWFRNTWAWACEHEGCTLKPSIKLSDKGHLVTEHETLNTFHCWAEGADEVLFTENETNAQKLWGTENTVSWVKDAFHDYVINGQKDAVCPKGRGTKAAFHYVVTIPAGGQHTVRLRLSSEGDAPARPFGAAFDRVFKQRIAEADEFYNKITGDGLEVQENNVLRQAYAGLLQSKQFYHYSVRDWLRGDAGFPKPPPERKHGRNADWEHLFNRDVISMPDKWEYPWFAAWDLSFHMIPFDKMDPEFAKSQMMLLLREWYMHPNGQIPAYEWNFSDVNPPVHAWAVWRLYKMTGRPGHRDLNFLGQCFHKLLLNFTWWVNRKDPEGHNVFAGGFLGLDNIGAFDRSKPLPGNAELFQADGTAWMAFYSATMLSIALELASHDRAYEGVASKFFEHFVSIGEAANTLAGSGLWNHEDGFYYDMLRVDKRLIPMKIRSMVGILAICAVEILPLDVIERLPEFKSRMQWYIQHNHIFEQKASSLFFGSGEGKGKMGKMLLALPSRHRLERVLQYVFDESEFLSPYGIRSLSKYHKEHPYVLEFGGERHEVRYDPCESDSFLFGGNSNWRGPVWFPVNYILLEALEKYHHFFGSGFTVELPRGSGNRVTLEEAANEIARRLTRLFLPDAQGNRPIHRQHADWYRDPHFKDLVLFYEYFDGDTGRGVGASHQTGWTGLVAKLLEDRCRACRADFD